MYDVQFTCNLAIKCLRLVVRDICWAFTLSKDLSKSSTSLAVALNYRDNNYSIYYMYSTIDLVYSGTSEFEEHFGSKVFLNCLQFRLGCNKVANTCTLLHEIIGYFPVVTRTL